jgi:hypothetical protein
VHGTGRHRSDLSDEDARIALMVARHPYYEKGD